MSNEGKTANGSSSPLIVAVEMGYGHLRAAYNLAELFNTNVLRMDLPPIAGSSEVLLWRTVRRFYNGLSRACDWHVVGPAAQCILEKITEIKPLEADKDGSANLLTRVADGLAGAIIGRRLHAVASRSERPIIATYPLAALAARHATRARVFCLVTDTDLNRAWAPAKARQARIDYLAPMARVAERLRTFGVPDQRIHLTGFPLPPKLLARMSTVLARRIHRLDPACVFRNQASREIALLEKHQAGSHHTPITLTFAIGGAGAQTRHVGEILRSLGGRIARNELRVMLVAGMRRDVAETLRKMVESNGLGSGHPDSIHILLATKAPEYFRRFEECLAETDVLWTKPSELVFYAALGLPILLAPAVGGQERANRDWLLSNKAALDCGDPAAIDRRLDHLLATGELCRVAWNAYSNLDRNGSDRICRIMESFGSTRVVSKTVG